MNAHKQSGLSLIEIMVAVVISSILILGVTDLFNSSFMGGRSNSELAQMQESGRLAMEIIGADARLAGLQTCTTENVPEKPLENAVVLAGSGKTLTLRYIDPRPSECTKPNPPLQTVTYTFTGTGLTRAESGAAAQPLLDNVDGTFTLLPDSSDPDTANAVRVALNVQSTQAGFSAREFSSTYEFKNRLIAKD